MGDEYEDDAHLYGAEEGYDPALCLPATAGDSAAEVAECDYWRKVDLADLCARRSGR